MAGDDEEEETGLSDQEYAEWYGYGEQAFQDYYDSLSDVTIADIIAGFLGSRFYKPPRDYRQKEAYDCGWKDARMRSGL